VSDERTDVVIYTQGWDIDQPADGPPKGQIYGRMFVNGVEIPGFVNARTLIGVNDVMSMVVRLYPSTLEIVPCANINVTESELPKSERRP
jgi:hypothetical protein